MAVELCLVGLVLATVLLTCAGFLAESNRPARTVRAQQRPVEPLPRTQRPSEVERVLAEEISDEVASFVCTTAADRGIKTPTMRTFVDRFGAGALALAVAADFDHGDLLRCLLRAELPDRESMLMAAALNGVSCDWYVAA